MSILEVCAIIATSILALMGAVSGIGLARFGGMRRRAEVALDRLEATLASMDRLLSDSHVVVHDLRRLESRVQANVKVILDQIEPPIRTAAALLAAVRTSAHAWLAGSDRRA